MRLVKERLNGLSLPPLFYIKVTVMVADCIEVVLRGWVAMCNYEKIQGYFLGRYEIDVPIVDVRSMCREIAPCGVLESSDVRMSLKKRLVGRGFLKAGGEGWPELRFAAIIHTFDCLHPPAPCVVDRVEYTDADVQEFSRYGWQTTRPNVVRLRSSRPLGVNRLARKLVNENTNTCLYCRRIFRNPSALVLHLEQSHPAALVRSAETTG